MINRLFLILNATTELPSEIIVREGIFFSFFIIPTDEETNNCLYLRLNDNPLQPFCLTIDSVIPFNEGILKCITAFLFLPNYIKNHGVKEINMLGGSVRILGENLKLLQTYLLSQALDNVLINQVSNSPTIDKEENFVESNSEFLSRYQLALRSDTPCNNSFFLKVNSFGEATNVIESVVQAENDLNLKTPTLYSLILQQLKAQKQLSLLQQQQQGILKELQNQKTYNQILRTNHYTGKLQEYYNNEYEILPNWYKRLGHLIKVLTGKRTFRSLFRKDKKIYNQ